MPSGDSIQCISFFLSFAAIKCLAAIIMPRGDSSYIDCPFVPFFYALKCRFFFVPIVITTCMCTMSASFDDNYWPVGARMENYILITEYMSFTEN